MKVVLFVLLVVIHCLPFLPSSAVAELPATIEKVKPSIIAIGTYKKTQSPPFIFRGTGFVVGDGTQAITNAHVLPSQNEPEALELAVLTRTPQGNTNIRRARVITKNIDRDLALNRPGN